MSVSEADTAACRAIAFDEERLATKDNWRIYLNPHWGISEDPHPAGGVRGKCDGPAVWTGSVQISIILLFRAAETLSKSIPYNRMVPGAAIAVAAGDEVTPLGSRIQEYP